MQSEHIREKLRRNKATASITVKFQEVTETVGGVIYS